MVGSLRGTHLEEHVNLRRGFVQGLLDGDGHALQQLSQLHLKGIRHASATTTRDRLLYSVLNLSAP
eukprot:7523762-Pyramimonas_sp.AAC.1